MQGTGKGDIPGTWSNTKVAAKGEKLEASYYVWLYEGDQAMSNLMTGLLIGLFILITCFPIWPDILKLILWYISCTLLVLIIITILVRWFLFLFVWIFGYEFWVLPNLFDEERSVADSFKPAYSFEKTGPGQMWWRMGVLMGFVGFMYWAYTQPTDFDDFLKSNRQFVDDLYDGNLLSDASQFVRVMWLCLSSGVHQNSTLRFFPSRKQSKENIDNPYKIPTIDDLLSDIEDEAAPSVDEVLEAQHEENADFLGEEDEDANVDAMLDSLFDDEED